MSVTVRLGRAVARRVRRIRTAGVARCLSHARRVAHDRVAACRPNGWRGALTDTKLTRTIASTATLKIANIHSEDLFYTPLEERFERITRVARRALQVPVAAITLLNDDKQWFKSAAGWGISELPRAHSICRLTIEENRLLTIPNL